MLQTIVLLFCFCCFLYFSFIRPLASKSYGEFEETDYAMGQKFTRQVATAVAVALIIFVLVFLLQSKRLLIHADLDHLETQNSLVSTGVLEGFKKRKRGELLDLQLLSSGRKLKFVIAGDQKTERLLSACMHDNVRLNYLELDMITDNREAFVSEFRCQFQQLEQDSLFKAYRVYHSSQQRNVMELLVLMLVFILFLEVLGLVSNEDSESNAF